jgi:hypothetical protein
VCFSGIAPICGILAKEIGGRAEGERKEEEGARRVEVEWTNGAMHCSRTLEQRSVCTWVLVPSPKGVPSSRTHERAFAQDERGVARTHALRVIVRVLRVYEPFTPPYNFPNIVLLPFYKFFFCKMGYIEFIMINKPHATWAVQSPRGVRGGG